MEPDIGKMAAPGRAPPPTPAPGSSGSLAMVVDKRPPHRSGGCVSIFFQLFDWNRRLSNKKFFSRKLLPQVRAAKKISKKFAGDEKMPAAKLLLIADENRGGFPSAKKAEACGSAAMPSIINPCRENGMCTPSLVARLMGLDSMPSVTHHDEPRKAVDGAASSSDSGCYFDGSDTSGSSRHYQELGLEAGVGSGHPKLDRRPQKLQKTGFFDRRPVAATARVSPEALLLNKNVLTRSRKRHPKLASPVKSHRLLGRRSSARLMEAATRILEPGLQARNHARCSLTYMAPLQSNVMEGVASSPFLKRPGDHPLGAPLISPCKNCGNLVQVPDIVLKTCEPSGAAECGSASTSEFSNTSSHDTHDGFIETVSEAQVTFKDDRKTQSLAVQAKVNVHSRSHGFVERKSLLPDDLQQRRKLRQEIAVSRSGLKQNNVKPNEMILVKKAASAPKLDTTARQLGKREPRSSTESRDFVSMNRNVSNCSRTRAAPKPMDNQRRQTEGNAWDKKSLVRKRSAGNITQTEVTDSAYSNQRSARSGMHDEKGTKLASAHSIIGSSHKLRAGDFGGGSKNSGIVSFGFSAAIGNGITSSGSVSEESKAGHARGGISRSGRSSRDSASVKLSYERVPDKKVDALSTLLEQKIKELTCLNQDDSVAEGDDRSRSTAAILEELIAALTAARPMPQNKECESIVGTEVEDGSCYDSKGPSDGTHAPEPKPSTIKEFQGEEKSGILHYNDYDQPSPVSILEASFSNDSCLSESFNSSSGHRPHIGFTDGSSVKLKSWELDADLSDSATSTGIKKIESGRIPLSLDNIFFMNVRDSYGFGNAGDKHEYVREVLSKCEMIFEVTSLEVPDRKIYSPINLMLLDTLDTLLYEFWECPNSKPKFSATDEELKSRRFMFDLIMEHLDVKYRDYGKIGYNAWVKVPVLTRDKLTQEIGKEMRNCRDLAGKTLGEIVEKDMSYMSGKWEDFDSELFEAGVEIENDLLQLLVDETVINILHC